ncbi:MAG: hypothetical protein ABI693_25965 [Bryobacteraceae bacterium]
MFDSMRRLGGLLFLLLAVSGGTRAAGPALTTIQDTLYKADGTPFTGLLYINWKSFTTADAQNVATQNLVATVVNGVLHVQLAPTTNAASGAYYQVGYNSNGSIQFNEYWAVPPSSIPVALKDVRMASPPGSVGGSPPPPSTTIQISDIAGLSDELAAHVLRGPGYSPMRTAVVNPAGMLESAIGNVYDCVKVDGTSGPCGSGGGSAPSFYDGETPAGNVDGSNAVFTLSQIPSPAASLQLYRNGVLQKPAVDFTLASNIATFTGGSIPTTGDILVASYRIAAAGGLSAGLGGALEGDLPNPSLAPGVVTDYNIAPGAGIAEDKLALNFSTHSNTNDPSPEQKQAMAGTAGVVSGGNRYVTEQDPRMTDARATRAHGLLSASHNDTVTAIPFRGDMIVAQGSGTWTRLPLGAPNRCLMSNGSDAVWNTCLFTGFAAGSLPFVDASGSLTQNNAKLFWDNSNRRFGIGTNSAGSTLHVQDATPSIGSTTVTVRAGQGQGTNPLGRWLDINGAELARMDGQGVMTANVFQASTNSQRAGWRDGGYSADPANQTDGDSWYNTNGKTRRTREGGQVHTTPQVICSSNGGVTGNTTTSSLGTCTIPAGMWNAGDRFELKFDFTHDGSTNGFTVQVAVNQTVLTTRSMPPVEGFVTGSVSGGLFGGGLQWNSQTWGSAFAMVTHAGSMALDPSSELAIDLRASQDAAGSETVTLQNFTLIRYPAQVNP